MEARLISGTSSSFKDLTGLTRDGRRSSKSESAGLLVARGEELKSVMASPTGRLFVDNAGEELHGVAYADSRSLRAECSVSSRSGVSLCGLCARSLPDESSLLFWIEVAAEDLKGRGYNAVLKTLNFSRSVNAIA